MSNKDHTPRLCIWCAGEYRFSDSNADECFCPSCRRQHPEQSLGQARNEWMAVKLTGPIAIDFDLGHSPSEDWPTQFPIATRNGITT